jgi:CubicO group peptidase (beta-lactamase class C family)
MMMENTFKKARVNQVKKWQQAIFFYLRDAIVCGRNRRIAMISLVLFTACSERKENADRMFSKSVTAAVDQFISDTHATYPLPGIGVGIVHNHGEYVHYEGTANSTSSFSDTTVFFSGSISELLVATTVLRLADTGKISLDDPIVKHLPYFKLVGESYRSITIRHMLTHASGIPHHGVIYDPPSYDDYALEATTRSIEHQEAAFKAGSQIKRSPYNYDILADVVAKVSGEKFETYARTNVLLPLGMKHSTFSFFDIPSKALARPHHVSDWLAYQVKESVVYPYSREHAGSRGFHTTLRDINQWMAVMLNRGKLSDGEFLSEEMVAEFMKRCYRTGTKNFTGIGWDIEESFGTTVYRKGDNEYGFSASLMLMPDLHVGMLTVSNISGDFNPEFVNQEIARMVTGAKLGRVKIPASIVFSRKLAATNSLDSAIAFYNHAKDHPEIYDVSEEELSQPGVNLLYRLNRQADAIRVFEFCLENYPKSPTAYLNLAEAHLLQQDLPMAIAALEKAKQLNPESPDARARIAFVEERLKVSEEKVSQLSSIANQ